MTTTIGKFLAGMLAAFLLKLATAFDDIIWFAPFLAHRPSKRKKMECCLVYSVISISVAVLAIGLALAAEEGFHALFDALSGDEKDGFWDAETVLDLVASVFLFAFAVKEYLDWRQDGNRLPSCGSVGKKMKSSFAYFCVDRRMTPFSCDRRYTGTAEDNDDDTKHSDITLLSSPATKFEKSSSAAFLSISEPLLSTQEDSQLDGTVQGKKASLTRQGEDYILEEAIGVEDNKSVEIEPNDDESLDGSLEENVQRAANMSLSRLVVISICGLLDSLVVFAASLLSHSMSWYALLAGVLVADTLIISLSVAISLLKPFADFVLKLPVWTLILMVATFILVDAIIS